ncbi:MAG: hypothetical protein M3Y08_08120 [Fibrobacterota bacterium]|nr:hypothetical protein [Fibrobacterota bacterium]
MNDRPTRLAPPPEGYSDGMVGVKDEAEEPPPGQLVPETPGEQIHKRVSERTVNVQLITHPRVE